jgi:hypothetical protein
VSRLIVIALAAILSGCVFSKASRSVSVQPADVHAFAAVCSAPVPGLSPSGYTYAGFDFVDEQCGIFFDGIVELSKNSRFASSSIATANSQAATIMAAVDVASKAIGIVAAGSELARKVIDGYAAEYAFAPYALEVRQLALNAMTAYRNAGETDRAISALAAAPTEADAYCLANNVVRNYAKICAIANVEALARQAVANSKITKSQPSAGAERLTLRQRLSASDVGPRTAVRRATEADIVNFRRGLGLPNYTAGAP